MIYTPRESNIGSLLNAAIANSNASQERYNRYNENKGKAISGLLEVAGNAYGQYQRSKEFDTDTSDIDSQINDLTAKRAEIAERITALENANKAADAAQGMTDYRPNQVPTNYAPETFNNIYAEQALATPKYPNRSANPYMNNIYADYNADLMKGYNPYPKRGLL